MKISATVTFIDQKYGPILKQDYRDPSQAWF